MAMVLAQLDPTGIFDLGNTSLIFWEIITFFILLFLLLRYVYPPIRKQIQERQAQIEKSIDEAEKTRSEARELLAEYRRQIEEAREEIDRERESAVREVRSEVADMVVQASEQVIGRSVDRDEHESLISQALDDLESEVAGTRSGTA